MTVPANVRVNIGAPFPSLVKASGPVTIAKQNGIWTVGFSFNGLGVVPANANLNTLQLLVYNTGNASFQTMTAGQLINSATPNTIVTSAQSPYTPLPTDTFLLVDTTGGAVTINLDFAANRAGLPLSIKDYKGNAAANNITIVPQNLPAEKIDNFTHAAPLVLNANFDGVTLRPATALYVIAP